MFVLRVAAVDAEQANRVKIAFLANMSDERRTRLNGTRGSETDEQQELCRLIADSAAALTRLTSDILDYVRIDAG